MNFFDARLSKVNGKYAVSAGGITVELSDDKQERLNAKNVAEQDVTLGVRPDTSCSAPTASRAMWRSPS